MASHSTAIHLLSGTMFRYAVIVIEPETILSSATVLSSKLHLHRKE